MRYDHDSMLPERAFMKVGGRMTLEGGGKGGSAPPAPDYTGAAQAQATSSKETTNMANYANRPTINTPFGGQSWTQGATIDPGTGQAVTTWTQNTTLSPESQAALNSQLAMQQGRSDIANRLMPAAEAAVTTPIDYDKFSQPGKAPTLSQFQGLNAASPMQSTFQAAQGMPGTFSYTDTSTPFSTNAGKIQAQLDTSGVSKLGQYDRAFVNDALNEALDYMRPDQERAQSALETKLVNQGLTRGSEAYNNAYRQMMDQQSRDKFNALQTAYNQGNQMYQNQLAANNQTFNQALNTGNFANQAQNQQFNQSNQAWQNNYNLQNQQFARENQAFQNNFNLGNTAFNQAQAAAQFANQAAQQDFANQQNVMQFNNTNLQNQFAQEQNLANYQNQLRQQQIAEAQQRQLQPLNNINALLTGQQVGMPQMPSFNANQAAQPVNYLGAAQAQGNYGLQAQSMNNASANSQMSGITSLLGTAAGAAMAFSDKRLKRDIKFIKKFGKLNWYRYRYVGSDTWHEGVLAHEVKKVIPEAVVRHANGYDMVNYALLGA